MVPDITNIKEVLDPQARHIFFDDEGMTEALPIGGIEGNSFLVHSTQELPSKKRNGYFIAASGRGIVRFQAQCEAVSMELGDSSHLYRVVPDLKKLTLVNRREFNRFEFAIPVPISLACEGRFIKASLINISEGGLRMSVAKKLVTQVIYRFDVHLPFPGEDFHFVTDGLVIYCEPEETPDAFMTGVTFVAPPFRNPKEKKAYLGSRQKLARLIGRYLKPDSIKQTS